MNPSKYQFGMSFNPSDFNVDLGSFNPSTSSSMSFDPLSAGINVLGGIAQQGLAMWNQSRQWKKQEEWYNKYQSPVAQMQQMVAAGINPNAAAAGIAGNGAGQSMNPATPSQTAGVSEAVGNLLGNSYNSAVNAANIRQSTEQIMAATKDLNATAEGKMLDNDMKRVELGFKPKMMQAELDESVERANQIRQQIVESKKEVDKMDAEINKLKEEKETIIQERGLIEYEKALKEAQTKREEAAAALDNVIASMNKNSLEYQYALAVKNHGSQSPEAKEALKAMTNKEEGVSQAQSQGKMNVEFGHTGMVGQTLDAIRRFSGNHQNYGINDILGGFGVYFDNNGRPQFKPIVKLFNRINRPSYDKWKSNMNSEIRNKIAYLQNDYRNGKLNKSEYQDAYNGLKTMLDNLTMEAYKKTFDIR